MTFPNISSLLLGVRVVGEKCSAHGEGLVSYVLAKKGWIAVTGYIPAARAGVGKLTPGLPSWWCG